MDSKTVVSSDDLKSSDGAIAGFVSSHSTLYFIVLGFFIVPFDLFFA